MAIRFWFLILVISFSTSSSPVGAQPLSRDAGELLRNAAEAIRNVQSVSYIAEFYALGPREQGGKPAGMFPAVRGEVKLERIAGGDPYGARITIQGEIRESDGE